MYLLTQLFLTIHSAQPTITYRHFIPSGLKKGAMGEKLKHRDKNLCKHMRFQVLMSSYAAMLERLESFFGCSFKEEEKEEPKGWNGSDFPRSHIHILDSISGVDG